MPTPATLPDNLIDTYGLVKSSQTRTALTEDLQKAGERRLREALKQAALSNSRGKVSVNFYRTILYDTGRAKERRGRASASSSAHRQPSVSMATRARGFRASLSSQGNMCTVTS